MWLSVIECGQVEGEAGIVGRRSSSRDVRNNSFLSVSQYRKTTGKCHAIRLCLHWSSTAVRVDRIRIPIEYSHQALDSGSEKNQPVLRLAAVLEPTCNQELLGLLLTCCAGVGLSRPPNKSIIPWTQVGVVRAGHRIYSECLSRNFSKWSDYISPRSQAC